MQMTQITAQDPNFAQISAKFQQQRKQQKKGKKKKKRKRRKEEEEEKEKGKNSRNSHNRDSAKLRPSTSQAFESKRSKFLKRKTQQSHEVGSE